MLEALNAGALDIAQTGEAPPIFAQAAGPRLTYLAAEPPAPKGEAILVKGDSAITSVADASFIAEPGVVTGLLGPNGAGKSSVMRIICDLDRADAGTATVCGRR